MKKILSFFFMMAFIGGSLLLPGCEVDYYEPSEDDQGTGSSLFGEDVTVPSGFDWATTHTVNVSVKVDDQYNGNYYYTVELFDANPLFDENATLLSKGVAKKNNDFSVAVALPQATETVYVQQTNPTGKQAVKVFQVSDHTSIVNFGGMSSSALKSATADSPSMVSNNTRATTSGYDIPTRVYLTPANAIDITVVTVNELSSGQSYKIPAGKTYDKNINFAWGDGADLYIEGIWNAPSGTDLRHSRLVIQDGGEFNPGGNVSGNNSRIVVASSGKFNKDGKVIDILNNNIFQIVNNGLFKVRDISNIRGFYNYGEMNVTRNLFTNTTNIVFVNEKTLTVGGDITLKGSNKLLNYDILNITGDLLSDSENTEILNEKTLTVGGKVTLNKYNKLYNHQTMSVGSLEVNTNNVTVESKRLTVGTIKVNGSNHTINNSCQIIANDIILTGGESHISINISQGSLLRAQTVSTANSKINLESHAILEVNQELTFTNNGSSINGPSTGNEALARLNKVTVRNWTRPSYGGYMVVECANHSPNEDPTPYTVGTNVTFVRDAANSSLDIPETDCNDGGYSTPSGSPSNPVFPVFFDGVSLTYLFEDNWPYLGDYDMNDMVLDVKPAYSQNSSNKVTELKLDVTLRAVGASKRLAAGVQLEGIDRGMISSVSRTGNAGVDGTVFIQSGGLESGQTYAVIPFFDDVHAALGHSSPVMTNTIKGSKDNVPSTQVKFTIVFNSPLDLASITVDKFNVFIINAGYKGKRQEVHMPGFQPTDKVDKSKFGKADDNSNVKLYTSKENMIWGLAIPGPAKYPVEFKSILLAYPDLESWATSGGTNAKDWYKNFNENVYN